VITVLHVCHYAFSYIVATINHQFFRTMTRDDTSYHHVVSVHVTTYGSNYLAYEYTPHTLTTLYYYSLLASDSTSTTMPIIGCHSPR